VAAPVPSHVLLWSQSQDGKCTNWQEHGAGLARVGPERRAEQGLAVTLQDLIALYRTDSQDGKHSIGGGDEDVLCSDESLTLYANEAQDEACRRGQLLRDSSSALCSIAFNAGDESVPLDAKVVRVLRAFVDGQPVGAVDAEVMDCAVPGWQFDTRRDMPRRLVSGMTTGRLYLWPVPAQAGTIRLTVQRLPLEAMVSLTDEPEIRPELHRALVPWMLYRAYSRVDTDLYNDAKAAVQLAKFEAEFGRKASGRNEEWVRNGQGEMPAPIA
jgi:hypothetical protein